MKKIYGLLISFSLLIFSAWAQADDAAATNATAEPAAQVAATPAPAEADAPAPTPAAEKPVQKLGTRPGCSHPPP